MASTNATPAATCVNCGAVASGNFCSHCGSELDSGGIMGLVGGSAVRQSVPATYLRILRSPVAETVALADDPLYRNHIAFLLAGLAVFCALFLPILMQDTLPVPGAATISEGMRTWLSILSQAGTYVGTMITFLVAYGLFRVICRAEPRTFASYFKLFCIAAGFVQPLYAGYEHVTRAMLHGTGMSSFQVGGFTTEAVLTPSFAVSATLTLLLWYYMIAIHRRFWRTSWLKAIPVYVVASMASFYASFWVMYFVGFYSTRWLVAAGILSPIVRP